MLDYDFQNSVGHWICSAARLVERSMNTELEPEGITFRQCQVLAWLSRDGALPQIELAERMNIEPATLVSVLDRMERDGWIERTACPDDRRRKIIRPLAKAEPAWEKIVACARRVRSRASQGLSGDEQRTLKRLLSIVESNLSRPERGHPVVDVSAKGHRAGSGISPD